MIYKNFFKPVLDFLIAFLCLLILSPLFLIIFTIFKVESNGPLFFLQKRLGKQGKVFYLYKFRTMIDRPRKVKNEIYKNDKEVTKIGYFLRRFKIDELPQILNILKGDMSIVGPRPCMVEQMKDFNEDGEKRILVKPGLTGLAQINGNIYLSWKERWKYDRAYVENLNFLLDLSIVIKTVLIVLMGEDKFIKKPNA